MNALAQAQAAAFALVLSGPILLAMIWIVVAVIGIRREWERE